MRSRASEVWRRLVAHRAAALLDLDRPADAVTELSPAVARHHYDEHLHGLLLTALSRTGRHGEALERYDGLRRRLADDLGSDPGPDLQRLHLALLEHRTA